MRFCTFGSCTVPCQQSCRAKTTTQHTRVQQSLRHSCRNRSSSRLCNLCSAVLVGRVVDATQLKVAVGELLLGLDIIGNCLLLGLDVVGKRLLLGYGSRDVDLLALCREAVVFLWPMSVTEVR